MGHLSLPEIRLQIAAITLAEELNFTRAAERLRITQPAFSKQIAELEDRIGFLVFTREQKRVELTQAGEVFVRGCKDAHAILEKAVRLAKATHDEVRPVITIGHSPYADPALVSSLLAVHLPLYPELRLRMESMFALELAHGVLSAELDLALIAEPSASPLLTLVELSSAPLCAVLSADHPATSKQSVSIQDFENVGWMIFPRKAHPIIYDRVMDVARAAGVSPVELHHYVSPQQVIQLIEENFGVAFMAKGVADQLARSNVTVRPLSHESLRVTTYLALRADQSARLVNEFGRAFLRRVQPKGKLLGAADQMQLGL
jgi:DNA-binding transcriptional LysR family regulator